MASEDITLIHWMIEELPEHALKIILKKAKKSLPDVQRRKRRKLADSLDMLIFLMEDENEKFLIF